MLRGLILSPRIEVVIHPLIRELRIELGGTIEPYKEVLSNAELGVSPVLVLLDNKMHHVLFTQKTRVGREI